jgi:hypothetical protein
LASSWSARLSILPGGRPFGRGVGLHLGPLAAGAGRGRARVLLGILGGPVQLHLGLVDALAELVTGLRDGRLGRGLGLGGALLQVVELSGEFHGSPGLG